MPNKLVESLRRDLDSLHKAGAIGKATKQEFDAISPRGNRAADAKQSRAHAKTKGTKSRSARSV